jgi:hypothetical protein
METTLAWQPEMAEEAALRRRWKRLRCRRERETEQFCIKGEKIWNSFLTLSF